MSAEDWYYSRGDHKKGPLTLEQLRAKVIRGELEPHHLVWNDTMDEWAPISNVPGLMPRSANRSGPNYVLIAVAAAAALLIVGLGLWVTLGSKKAETRKPKTSKNKKHDEPKRKATSVLGWRKATWGMTATEVENANNISLKPYRDITLSNWDVAYERHLRQPANKKIGRKKQLMENETYYFQGGRLVAVTVQLTGKCARVGVVEDLTSNYGPAQGKRQETGRSVLLWTFPDGSRLQLQDDSAGSYTDFIYVNFSSPGIPAKGPKSRSDRPMRQAPNPRRAVATKQISPKAQRGGDVRAVPPAPATTAQPKRLGNFIQAEGPRPIHFGSQRYAGLTGEAKLRAMVQDYRTTKKQGMSALRAASEVCGRAFERDGLLVLLEAAKDPEYLYDRQSVLREKGLNEIPSGSDLETVKARAEVMHEITFRLAQREFIANRRAQGDLAAARRAAMLADSPRIKDRMLGNKTPSAKRITRSSGMSIVTPPAQQQPKTRANAKSERREIKGPTRLNEANEPAEKPRTPNFDHLSLGRGTNMGGFLRHSVPRESLPGYAISTKEPYAGDIEITAVVRTNGNNIRLFAFQSALLILNWKGNLRQLRVHRPDATVWNKGSIATAPVTPLRTNEWHTIKWWITRTGMDVVVDGQRLFSERRSFNLSRPAPVRISSAGGSVVDVKSLKVTRLGAEKRPAVRSSEDKEAAPKKEASPSKGSRAAASYLSLAKQYRAIGKRDMAIKYARRALAASPSPEQAKEAREIVGE